MKKIFLTFIIVLFSFQLFAQNNCLVFDGTDDYVTVADNSSLDLSSAMTIEFWINLSSSTGAEIISKSNGDGDENFRIYVDQSTDQIYFDYGDGDDYTNTYSFSLTIGIWYHFAFSVSAGSVGKIYVNGIEAPSYAHQEVSQNPIPTNDHSMDIGMWYDQISSYRYFSGKLDEVRIWNDIRNETEIRKNMYRELPNPTSESNLVAYYQLNSSLNDASYYSNNGVFIGGSPTYNTSSAIFGPKNCLSFDGSNDCVNCGTINLSSSPITLECWVNVDVFQSTSPYISSIMGTESGGTALLRFGDGGLAMNKVQFVIDIGGQTKLDGITGLDTDKWYHIAGVYDGSEMKIYINGKLDASKIQTGSISSNGPFYIASNIGGERYLDGSIDEVRVWSDARTASEIRENMCKNLTGNESGLVAYYNFDNNTSENTTLQDFSGNGNDGTCEGYISDFTGTASYVENDELYDEIQSWTTNEFSGKVVYIEGFFPYNYDILSNDDTSLYFDGSIEGQHLDVSYIIYDGLTEVGWSSSNAFNTWLNTSSSSWSTAANWSRGSVPGSSDNVGIYSYTGGTNLSLSGTPTINNLVLGGSSSMTLSSGTTVNSHLILESNLDLNGQTITLGSNATLIEDSGIINGSSGTITTTRSLNNIDENVAGLGAEITENGDLGLCTISRGVQAQGTLGIDRYYEITTEYSPTNATLVFHYFDSELNGITESSLALFKSSDAISWTEQEATLDTGNNTLTLTGIDNFSYWTAAETGSGPTLPVELSAFTAQFIENTLTIHWSTQSETDNMGWFIYRSVENDFSSSKVISKMIEGHGTTTEQQFYTHEDDLQDAQVGDSYYYWLESIDYSGIINHYDRVAVLTIPEHNDPSNNGVTEPERFGLFQNEPNPVLSSTKISFNLRETSKVDLTVYNLKGQLVKRLYSGVTSKQTLVWDGKDGQGKELKNGIYLYRLLINDKTEESKKLILMK